MKLISASRRTDIPAFYTPWLLNRLDAGFCHWLNPYSGRVSRVSLRPEDSLALVFWTRNPRPLLPHLDALRAAGYHFYFYFTLNGYPREIEANNPPFGVAVETFRRLSEKIGPEWVHWRYDPIVLSARTPPEYHREQFDRLSAALAGATRRCYFSFVDFYGKTARNLGRVEREQGFAFERPSTEAQRALARGLRDIAAPRGITLYSCCADELAGDGIEKARCLDPDLVRRLRPEAEFTLKAAPTRPDCGCVAAVDIGAYDTCLFGCTYCYATNSPSAARARRLAHDPADTLLWRPASLRGVDLAAREGSARATPKTASRDDRSF